MTIEIARGFEPIRKSCDEIEVYHLKAGDHLSIPGTYWRNIISNEPASIVLESQIATGNRRFLLPTEQIPGHETLVTEGKSLRVGSDSAMKGYSLLQRHLEIDKEAISDDFCEFPESGWRYGDILCFHGSLTVEFLGPEKQRVEKSLGTGSRVSFSSTWHPIKATAGPGAATALSTAIPSA